MFNIETQRLGKIAPSAIIGHIKRNRK